jgi:hypothetical protein
MNQAAAHQFVSTVDSSRGRDQQSLLERQVRKAAPCVTELIHRVQRDPIGTEGYEAKELQGLAGKSAGTRQDRVVDGRWQFDIGTLDHLLDEERATRRRFIDGRGVEIPVLHHLLYPGEGQSGEIDADGPGPEVGDDEAQGRILVEFLRAIGQDQTAVRGPDPPAQVSGQTESCLVGPVEIFEDEKDSVVLEHVEHPVVDAHAPNARHEVALDIRRHFLEELEQR